MKRLTLLSLAGALAIAGAATAAPAAQAAGSTRPDTARLTVVQALPGQSLDVDIDADTVTRGSDTGDLAGPFTVPAGRHQVTFRDASGGVVVATAVDLAPGSTQDLVVHLPAQVDGDPVATVYETPTQPLASGKARVLIAHTASVAPADVRLDGSVVFRNIANGEFATADVAEGDHVAELLPSGLAARPILGPLGVELKPATATMVYAVGNTDDLSMQAISHSISLGASNEDAPTTIAAGSEGLAAGIPVTPFSGAASTSSAADQERGEGPADWMVFGGLAGALSLAAMVLARSRITADVAP
ncbi:DUF4397 domain-containing protein [Nocardioides hwasunensis]|uniref:DUF4397 domain-containing protein n=1 Tax=Nocardioides hwasunensis TaxID=397258 RepID=A0ABR8MKZ5_9ACTN|nr:DUF4397 domain-containing protein [Nocardioides hwasunensis]MBD3915442.1 DUF4397 domain-containing protein [Nocardioides hwasunensis]